ncbi:MULTISPECIES: VOC family protein [unclassified Streptomyces]|uniref:VOC family protein n=1 Tax=unclassified Streptomyces TaxID=2593676 RepID=UPI00109E4B35|nr:VOC family protein [Streptomyces sp. A1136]THA53808.1 VOC family protein [Streptomyces sp. A1136]
MTITSVVLRRRVNDLERALPFYEKLTGETPARFAFAGLDLASVGPFLLFTGPPEVAARFAGVSATLGVADLDAVVATGVEAGAELVGAPTDTPNGRRAVLRHPDGAVYEYVGT